MSREQDAQIAQALDQEVCRDLGLWLVHVEKSQTICLTHSRYVAAVPYYSTDIAAAWSLIDRCYSGGVERLSGGMAYEAFVVIDRNGTNADGYASSDTPAAAIAAAFLAAMEAS